MPRNGAGNRGGIELIDVQLIAKTVAWWGFGLGLIFGFFANKTNFCTMGAVSDVVNMGDWGRMRAWMLAMAVAIIGTNVLAYSGAIDLGKTIYTGPNVPWLAHVVGGLCFGVGMTLASGCANKTLVRVGGGNLKSVVVFIYLGFAAFVTLRGILGAFRVGVLQAPAVTLHLSGSQTLPALLHGALGLDLRAAELAIALAAAGLLLAFVVFNREFWSARENLLAGLVVGAVIIAGWYVTGRLGLAEDPDSLEVVVFGTNSKLAESMSFVAPTAYTLEYWQYWTDASTVITFGIATVFGVGIGSFLYALATKSFRWEHFSSAQDMFRHIIGGTLMGFGGVTAMGCTIGQGITGVSTLSIGSILATVSIIIGAAATMKFEYWRMMREA
ncbi:MAG TPA: transporter [Rhodocyclaceae bacterium]|nr:MAG: transporter [Betaproteobacteria bacterium CG2_30_68_42]PIV72522.1 MAG: transporter [Rhodocyclales bacterium CG17_big_fil_post_rev_8_21_14_2_50_68_7]PIX74332.1 MAG: transporter [Rhodocyclales bacterium CG_4_10_14_3_um_filter_68_10]PJA58313.1 MAG: transporter [Rhodocyclales bacterium CG_4_9_14_3_um_filter_68_10]HCX33027.1 transporter [Rhodocyclaceae bacterium]